MYTRYIISCGSYVCRIIVPEAYQNKSTTSAAMRNTTVREGRVGSGHPGGVEPHRKTAECKAHRCVLLCARKRYFVLVTFSVRCRVGCVGSVMMVVVEVHQSIFPQSHKQ